MEQCWPPTVEQLSLFLSLLSLQNLSHKTARSYLSAIAFQCKLKGKADNTKHFILLKVLEGMKRDGNKCRTRLPITIGMLKLMVLKLPSICSNQYETRLFIAVFTVAFFGFFRVGELTVTKPDYVHRVVSLNDISFDKDLGTLVIKLRYSKADQLGKGVEIKLHKSGTVVCPVSNVEQYLNVRSKVDGPLFCHANGKPLSRYQFTAVLQKVLARLDINYNSYKAHSFRIGAATTAAEMGHSVEKIKLAGRWSSDAYRSYIKKDVCQTDMPNLSKD